MFLHHRVDSLLFKTRIVQDLAWVIASPPLVSGTHNKVRWWDEVDCKKEFNDCFAQLSELDKNPEPLEKHLAELKSQRLGLRFESYIAFWLEISPNYLLLNKNIQIIENGHTFGELDFIIQNIHSKKIIHLEVAVKFYLGMPQNNDSSHDPYHWFGTNTEDQLGKKVDHLKQHQTQLTLKHGKLIQKRLEYKIDEKQCFLKGRLFYPENCDTQPNGVNKNHLKGRWVQANDLLHQNRRFTRIDKKYWMAELTKKEFNPLGFQNGLCPEERAQCYVQQTTTNDEEEERIFNLPKDFWAFTHNDIS